jgi:hypothetical protein
MRKTTSAAAAAAICLLLGGCGSSLMRDAPTQEIAQSSPGKAKVVFMRSSMVAAAIGCDLFEVVNGELQFIGQLPTGNKIAYETTPGKKVFMAYGTAADFMLADLSAGKTYYSIVRPNWGTGGFAPTPIRSRGGPSETELKSTDFQGWLSGTKLLEPDPKAAEAWFAENKQRLQEIYVDYWNRFDRKSASEKAQRTLLPQDGQ